MCDHSPMDSDLPTNEFNQLDPTVKQWLRSFDNQNFTVIDLRKFWSIHVPDLFKFPINKDLLAYKQDRQKIDNVLFNPLEQFITGSANPKERFESLMKNDQHPKLCGKVFKSSEPIYTCRDCGVDSTCVRCVDCFKNSSHKNHRYKISMSNGGGFCDCGDVEAWKQDPFCDIHKQASGNDSASKLDDNIRRRFELVVKAIINYCYEILCWENMEDLPKDLESEEASKLDYHATVLFNDEIHTFDQVISSLTRAIICQKKEAKEFASLVDREGRTMVKVSTFEECINVKNTIEKATKRSHSSIPLKCEVMQISVVAHQEHALQLLDWLNKAISYHEELRTVFGLMMQTNVFNIVDGKEVYLNVNILNQVMTNDVNLWKTARNLWHKLFINGMLMNTESKKFFAKSFTRLYGQLMSDFINDNQDHFYSIMHLSIQIYSVPSLAHALIEEDDAFYLISKSFYNECEKHLEDKDKIQVKRELTSSFKRAQAVLSDLKYLLSTTPTHWTESLRNSFHHGFEIIITILRWMQDMDSITRQVGQHLEFESDWELAIYLQLKMSSVVTQLFEWCSSDFKVLKRSINLALKNLKQKFKQVSYKTWKLCDIECECIDYDVSSLLVTIHLALSRCVAGLLLELLKHDVKYSDLDTNNLTLIQLMELPLRTLVMISQFRASMWRRNGFSLVNQILFYHGSSFREEMYDKDIIMMQYAGSFIEPNEYLIHLLNKFNLMFWVQENYETTQRKQEEDFIRQTSVLVEEFLNLLLIIVGERYTLGIGSNITIEDKVKKEIIQWLCIEPCTHSDLIKNLSRPTVNFPMENLINEVAVFKKHKDNQSGKYELKEEYYKEFNPFFYHYTRIDQCSAEESQLKRKKQNNEEFVCCPPPVPPEFTKHFKPLRNILTSKVFMHLIKVILERVCDENTRSFSENQYEKILHLIGISLHEERRDLDDKKIPNENKYSFTQIAEKTNFLQLLKSCEQCPRVASHKSLTYWIQHKFKEIVEERHGKEMQSISLSNQTNSNLELETKDANAKRNSSMAAVLRQKIMAQMSAMQNKFIQDNAEYFENKDEDEQNSKQSSANDVETPNIDQLTYVNSDPIAIGCEQRGRFIETEPFFCMLCREQEDLNVNSSTCMVLAAFAQRSTVLSKNRKRKISVSQRKKNQNQESQQLTMSADLYCGTHVSTCGHVMHLDCYEQYIQNIQNRERRRPLRYGRHNSFNVEFHEYLCPLCECLSNTIIPIIPNSFYRDTLRNSKSSKIKINIDDWLSVMFSLISNSKYICENYASLTKRKVKLDPLDKVMENLNLSEESRQAFRTLEEVYSENADKVKSFDRRLVESLKKLSKSIGSVETGRDFDDLDSRAPLFTFWSCSFTMQYLEKLLREEYKPTFGDLSSRKHSCLQFLVRYCSVNSVIYDFNSIRNHCIDLLHYLLLKEKYNLNPSSILDVDAFSILISLILTSSSLFVKEENEENDMFKMKNCLTLPIGNVMDQYLVQLMVLFNIVQIILTQNELYEQTPMELDESALSSCSSSSKESNKMNKENRSIAMFYLDILTVAGIKSPFVNSSSSNNISNNLADSIATMLRSKLLPFLRCTALFYHFLTEIMPPNKLTNDYLQQKQSANSIEDLEEQEFLILCEYLALPKKLSELFSNVSLVKLAKSWARHPRISLTFEQHEKDKKLNTSNPTSAFTLPSIEQDHFENSYLPFKLIKQPHTTNRLIDLPEDYTELINNVALLPCPSADSYDSRCPTLCLVCGAMLYSNSYSCQKDVDGENYGACSYHTIECGAGVGIYLRTNDCKILLLAGKSKGCFLPAPYLDEYGETDTNLRRGNPLHLCKASYKKLCLLWLGHGIQEQVARQMETSPNIDTREWNLY